jgi:predicted secreted protein
MTVAKIGHGSKFALHDGAAPGALVDLAEILGVVLPEDAAETVEATHMESPGKRREYIGGLIETGEGEVAMNYAAGSMTDILIRGSFGERRAYKVTIPGLAGAWAVSGDCIIVGYGREVPIDDRMVATLRIKFSGEAAEGAAV